ncbi:MAG: tetratricopeptide repeat protein [Sandaracinaceae bacterium]|nr:tetratricopeptide repeat protein [Sandaracinaceae bacterium]
MAVYSENKDWSRLVEVILRIAELVEDHKQLTKYYNTAAAICHYELNRLDEAADYYEQALEHDPTSAKSFDGLVSALTAQTDWERLEEVYKARIKSVGDTGDAQVRANLWDQLGELLLHRLERKGDATEALEQAQKLDPGNRRRAEQLAEMYSAEPKRYFQKAVKVHGDLLRLNPLPHRELPGAPQALHRGEEAGRELVRVPGAHRASRARSRTRRASSRSTAAASRPAPARC